MRRHGKRRLAQTPYNSRHHHPQAQEAGVIHAAHRVRGADGDGDAAAAGGTPFLKGGGQIVNGGAPFLNGGGGIADGGAPFLNGGSGNANGGAPFLKGGGQIAYGGAPFAELGGPIAGVDGQFGTVGGPFGSLRAPMRGMLRAPRGLETQLQNPRILANAPTL